MRKVDAFLPLALKLSEGLQTAEGTGIIDKRVHSDISSFGTAVMQCGLLPAVAMFSNFNSDAGERHVKIMNVVFRLLHGEDPGKPLSNQEITKMINTKEPLLLKELLSQDKRQLDVKRRETVQACIALKLAVRTYELKEVNDAHA